MTLLQDPVNGFFRNNPSISHATLKGFFPFLFAINWKVSLIRIFAPQSASHNSVYDD